jgi:tetratricopeptide (TPR) repeat protein
VQGWGRRLLQTREQLDALADGDLLITLAETLIEPDAETAITSMGLVREYVEKDLLFTALEECLWAIQHAPYYLPLHLYLVDVLIKEGRLEEAVQKYITVADTYRVRGALEYSIIVYRKALKIAPMNVELREHLIGIFSDARMFDQAIEQYIALAGTYYQLAEVDRAIEKYEQALKYAPMGDSSRHWEANILHRVGDIHMQRVDWREAIKVYQRIKHMDAEDDRARAQLVDLHFKTGQRDQALRELDDLIELYKVGHQPRKMVSTLQDLVRSQPRELALHMRMAKTYLDLQMKDEAIAALDTVGEVQLEAGMTREAVRTIQAIIRLGPENVQGYQQLLAQLRGQ